MYVWYGWYRREVYTVPMALAVDMDGISVRHKRLDEEELWPMRIGSMYDIHYAYVWYRYLVHTFGPHIKATYIVIVRMVCLDRPDASMYRCCRLYGVGV